jgi:hypothetical protein
MKKSILLIALAAVLLSFVSYEDGEESAVPYGYPDSTVKAFLKSQESKYSAIPYFAKLDDQYLFYVVKGKWLDTSLTQFAKGDFLMGIVNERNEVILPVEYNKIYNPDATARGYIEIEKNGKRGLVNYHTKKVIHPVFDVIYPLLDWTYIAIGKIGDNFYQIGSSGALTRMENYYPVNSILNNWTKLQVPGSSLQLIYKCKLDSNQIEYREATGVVVKSSYLFCLNFIPEVILNVSYNHEHYSGFTNLESSAYNSTYNGLESSIWTMFSSFQMFGIEERGQVAEVQYLLSLNSKGEYVDSKLIFENLDSTYYYFSDREADFGRYFLNDSTADLVINGSIAEYQKYSNLTKHIFYRIHKDGKISQLNSNRIFDFTKFTIIDESYFMGTFVIMDKHENSNDKENAAVTDCLDREDLDLMRNEIYADYGYIFKTEKWKKYFESKNWYRPKYNDVDNFLSSIDKENLKTIINMQNKLVKNEKNYTNPHRIFCQNGYW